MNLRTLTSLLSYFAHPSKIVNKDFIWNYQKSQKDNSFRESVSGFRPFPGKPHKEK